MIRRKMQVVMTSSPISLFDLLFLPVDVSSYSFLLNTFPYLDS